MKISIQHWRNIIGIAGRVSIVTAGGFPSFWLAELGWNTQMKEALLSCTRIVAFGQKDLG